MALQKTDVKEVEIPDVVVDPSSKKSYQKGRFLGKVFIDFVEIMDCYIN